MVREGVSKEAYIKDELTDQLKLWIGVSIPLGIFLFLLLSILDWFATPELFSFFLKVRLSISALLLLAWLINRFTRNQAIQYTLTVAGAFMCAVAIEIMVIHLGGYSSGYYVGLGLVVIVVLGLVPVELWVALVVVVEVFLVYLVPILLTQKIDDLPLFINNLFFLSSISIISVVWRYLDQKRLVGELSLRYDLRQKQKELQEYSDSLEQLVEQRTKELKKSEKMLRAMFEHANDGILIMDETGAITDANKRACEILGFSKEDLSSLSIYLLDQSKDKDLWRERINRLIAGEPLIFETTYRRDGRKVFLEISASAVKMEEITMIQAFVRDITEKKRTQKRLLQSQKMESVVVLTGGLAHDFNNMLSVILGYIEVALMDPSLKPELRDKLEKAEKSAESAAQLVKKLLRFARKGEKRRELRSFDLNQTIGDALDLVSRNLPSGIVLKTELLAENPMVKGDSNDIEQVVINLVLNAKDAMPEGGEIKVRTNIDLLPQEIVKVESVEPDGYVHLSVLDTGTGIPDEMVPRIFDPFFTTKEKGSGTGLGLAMVYAIVKEHHGYILVESEEGKGSVFHVYLSLDLDSTAS